MSYTRTNWVRFMVLVACGSGLAACGESEPAAPRLRNLVYCENPEVAVPSCSIAIGYSRSDDSALAAKLEGCASAAGCHGANAVTSWTLNLSGSVENALAPLSTTLGVNGDYLVDQFDPDCSDMLRKLTSDWGAGQRMPLAGTPWSTEETDCFRSYLHEISN
ncbi:MAG: hypothetical protein OEN21_17755 [Myxococcales bacterium]|nr:hypothetical protein [Myxococcales bacterium]